MAAGAAGATGATGAAGAWLIGAGGCGVEVSAAGPLSPTGCGVGAAVCGGGAPAGGRGVADWTAISCEKVGGVEVQSWAVTAMAAPMISAAAPATVNVNRTVVERLSAASHSAARPRVNPRQRLFLRAQRWAASVIAPSTWRIRSAARSRSGRPASSHAMTASTATVGARSVAHFAQAGSGITSAK